MSASSGAGPARHSPPPNRIVQTLLDALVAAHRLRERHAAAAVEAARQRLRRLEAGFRDEEKAQARARLQAAEARIAQLEQQKKDLEERMALIQELQGNRPVIGRKGVFSDRLNPLNRIED